MRNSIQRMWDMIDMGFPPYIACLAAPHEGGAKTGDWARKAQQSYKEMKEKRNARRLHATT